MPSAVLRLWWRLPREVRRHEEIVGRNDLRKKPASRKQRQPMKITLAAEPDQKHYRCFIPLLTCGGYLISCDRSINSMTSFSSRFMNSSRLSVCADRVHFISFRLLVMVGIQLNGTEMRR